MIIVHRDTVRKRMDTFDLVKNSRIFVEEEIVTVRAKRVATIEALET